MKKEGEKDKKKLQKKCNVKQGQRVYQFLVDQFPKEYNAPTLAKMLKLPQGNIRVTLLRLCKKGKTKRTHRGFYRAILKRDLAHKLGDPAVKYHGIKLEGKVTKWIHGIDSVTFGKLLGLGFEERSNKRLVARLDWEGRRATVVVHGGKGFVDVFLRSSDAPLDGLELERFKDFVAGFLRPVVPWVGLSVRQIGVNRDFESVRLEGGGSVSCRVASNAIGRVYGHRGRGVRAEIHLDLEEARVMLEALSERPGGVWLPSGLGDRERLIMGGVLEGVAEGGADGVSFSFLWEDFGWVCRSEDELRGFLDVLKREGLVFEPVEGVFRPV